MDIQGTVFVNDAAIATLFGKIGTHCHTSGAVVTVVDKFFSGSFGRPISVHAEHRQAAAHAIKTLINRLNGSEVFSGTSEWSYVDRDGIKHGPFSHRKVLKWHLSGYFADAMPIEYSSGGSIDSYRVWVPSWFLEYIEDEGPIQRDAHDAYVNMEWESTAADVSKMRNERAMELVENSLLKEFPELLGRADHIETSAMDYDVIVVPSREVDQRDVRLVVILDTNVLLSHFSYLERTIQELLATSNVNGESMYLELMVFIPWIVLNELDHLKEGKHRQAAMYALKRIRNLTSLRDTVMHVQSASSHEKIVQSTPLSDQQRSLCNDDFILQTCMYWKRKMADAFAGTNCYYYVALVSNDTGLGVRSQALNLCCLKAVDFGVSRKKLIESLSRYQKNPSAKDEEEDIMERIRRNSRLAESYGADIPDMSVLSMAPSRTVAMAPTILTPKNTTPDSNDFGGHSGQQDDHAALQESNSLGLELDTIKRIISHSLGTFVMYFRQQDLGDMWQELLEDELKPPWNALQVLKIIQRHSTTFWDIFKKSEMGEIKFLLSHLSASSYSHHRIPVIKAVARLLTVAHASFTKSFDGVSPDPSSVEDFVSLGDAQKALEEGSLQLVMMASGQNSH